MTEIEEDKVIIIVAMNSCIYNSQLLKDGQSLKPVLSGFLSLNMLFIFYVDVHLRLETVVALHNYFGKLFSKESNEFEYFKELISLSQELLIEDILMVCVTYFQ